MNRLVIKQCLQQALHIVEGLVEKATDADMLGELTHLRGLILESLNQIDDSDFDEDQYKSTIIDIVDWLIRIYTLKEIAGI